MELKTTFHLQMNPTNTIEGLAMFGKRREIVSQRAPNSEHSLLPTFPSYEAYVNYNIMRAEYVVLP